MMKDNGSYCPLIFNEIYADNSGEYRLCCHARSTKTSQKYKSQNNRECVNFRKIKIVRSFHVFSIFRQLVELQ